MAGQIHSRAGVSVEAWGKSKLAEIASSPLLLLLLCSPLAYRTLLRLILSMSQTFWPFQVWGLRETIGTVSGQNPSLRAPPRLATGIRDVSLQMEVSPRQSRWKQILVSHLRCSSLHYCTHPACSSRQNGPVGSSSAVHGATSTAVRLSRSWQLKSWVVGRRSQPFKTERRSFFMFYSSRSVQEPLALDMF